MVVGVLTATSGTLGTAAGIGALLGGTVTAALPGLLPLSGVVITLDPLGGVFLAASGGYGFFTVGALLVVLVVTR